MARLLLALLVVAALALDCARGEVVAATNATAFNQTLLNETLATIAARTPANVSFASDLLREAGSQPGAFEGLPLTMVLPTDEATDSFLQRFFNTTRAAAIDKEALATGLVIIQPYHWLQPGNVSGAYAPWLVSNLTDGARLPTMFGLFSAQLNSTNLTVSISPGSSNMSSVSFVDAYNGTATIITPDVRLGTSVVHIIDAVLQPPGAVEELREYVAARRAARAAAGGNSTAPANSSVAAEPTGGAPRKLRL